MIENAADEMVDFFELKDRPVVINRQSQAAWVWTRGEWHRDTSIADLCYIDGQSLDRETFIRLHPYAALELLELSID